MNPRVKSYLTRFPRNVRIKLKNIRSIILENAPEAEEGFSYGMPAYKLFGKPLIYFAAFEKHIGLYATPSGHAKFAKELSKYKQGKGSVQFPLDKEVPYELIAKMVRFNVKELSAKQI